MDPRTPTRRQAPSLPERQRAGLQRLVVALSIACAVLAVVDLLMLVALVTRTG
jgi:hypothetical protein